jgi:hypothetical protein
MQQAQETKTEETTNKQEMTTETEKETSTKEDTTTKKETSTDRTEEKTTLKDKIEDFDNYQTAEIKTFGLTPCDDKDAEKFIENAEKTGIKELVLFDKPNYKITLYLTGNPDNADFKTFEKMVNACVTGPGMVGALKAFDDNLLWGNYMCSSGVALEEGQPGHEEYAECTKISKELDEYFNQ